MSMLKIKLVKSRFGLNPNHVRVVRALGLRKIGQVKELPDCPVVRGMITKVKYLLEVSNPVGPGANSVVTPRATPGVNPVVPGAKG